jgi:trigger factor
MTASDSREAEAARSETSPGLSYGSREESPVLRVLDIELAPERVRAAFDRAYQELARSARVKGFRPGRAPRTVLEKLYGASLGEEVERALVQDSLPEVLIRSGLEPVAEPRVESQAAVPDAAFRYVARIEVRPAIALPDLTGLAARRPAVAVREEDVEQQLEELRARRASLVDESPETPAATGHFVTLDYVGRIDGKAFEGGSARGVVLEMGSGRFIPGFEEQLEGALQGADREVRVRFPEDHGDPALAGKEAVFAVHVAGLRRRELPALDDAFAREAGLEGLDALRQRVREGLLAERERHAQAELRRSLLGAALERTSFEVPAGLVERRLERRLALAHRQLGEVMPHDELHERLAAWREEWRPAAELEAREELLLEAVAADRGVAVDDAEIDERLDRMARDQGLDPSRLRKAYAKEGMRDALRVQMVQEKALDLLRAGAKIEETPGS